MIHFITKSPFLSLIWNIFQIFSWKFFRNSRRAHCSEITLDFLMASYYAKVKTYIRIDSRCKFNSSAEKYILAVATQVLSTVSINSAIFLSLHFWWQLIIKKNKKTMWISSRCKFTSSTEEAKLAVETRVLSIILILRYS